VRVVSHTCSNTEIVCALGCAEALVAIDSDSDFPPELLAHLPKLGRDLELDVAAVARLAPDLVLTSLTVPGHERIVAELQALGLATLVIDPCSLEDVYASIAAIAHALGVEARGTALIESMRSAMPPCAPVRRPTVLVEWWPKPSIVPGRLSWVTDLIELAGGRNPFAAHPAKSFSLSEAEARAAAPEAIVMSWCGVRIENYRAEVVLRREGWSEVPAIATREVHAITEAWLGRPGPRLTEGYRALRTIVEKLTASA
jgi:iron complex transport system substrate-binding protein